MKLFLDCSWFTKSSLLALMTGELDLCSDTLIFLIKGLLTSHLITNIANYHHITIASTIIGMVLLSLSSIRPCWMATALNICKISNLIWNYHLIQDFFLQISACSIVKGSQRENERMLSAPLSYWLAQLYRHSSIHSIVYWSSLLSWPLPCNFSYESGLKFQGSRVATPLEQHIEKSKALPDTKNIWYQSFQNRGAFQTKNVTNCGKSP